MQPATCLCAHAPSPTGFRNIAHRSLSPSRCCDGHDAIGASCLILISSPPRRRHCAANWQYGSRHYRPPCLIEAAIALTTPRRCAHLEARMYGIMLPADIEMSSVVARHASQWHFKSEVILAGSEARWQIIMLVARLGATPYHAVSFLSSARGMRAFRFARKYCLSSAPAVARRSSWRPGGAARRPRLYRAHLLVLVIDAFRPIPAGGV